MLQQITSVNAHGAVVVKFHFQNVYIDILWKFLLSWEQLYSVQMVVLTYYIVIVNALYRLGLGINISH